MENRTESTFRSYLGIMENKMETMIKGYMRITENKMETIIRGCMGITENKMETLIRGYIGFRVQLIPDACESNACESNEGQVDPLQYKDDSCQEFHFGSHRSMRYLSKVAGPFSTVGRKEVLAATRTTWQILIRGLCSNSLHCAHVYSLMKIRDSSDIRSLCSRTSTTLRPWVPSLVHYTENHHGHNADLVVPQNPPPIHLKVPPHETT